MLVGIAGSHNAMSLSVYNLKAYALLTAPPLADAWTIDVIQYPLLAVADLEDRAERLCAEILAGAPDLVGFSVYMWNVAVVRHLVPRLKALRPGLVVVLGGPEIASDYVLAGQYDDLAADFLVCGEGEVTFRELLEALGGARRPSEILGLAVRTDDGRFELNGRRPALPSIDAIPSPYLTGMVDDALLARPRLEANLETQRGCTLRCSYCIYHKDMPRIAYSAVDRIAREAELVHRHGVRRIRFVDANFASDLPFAKEIIRALIDRRLEARLMFELIPGFLDEELAGLFAAYEAMFETNRITLGVGVQTINFDVLKKMRRAIGLDRFESTFDLIERFQLYAKIDLIIGLPGEDLRSITETLEYFLNRLRHSNEHLLCCHVMRGLPGTELLEIARQHDMVFSSEREEHELIESPALPRAAMLRCLRRTAIIFRLVNHAGWTRREFLTEKVGGDTSVRDAFFAARERLGCRSIEVVDVLVERATPVLRARGSWFAEPDFPNAETWWWSRAMVELSGRWLVETLGELTVADLGTITRSPDHSGEIRTRRALRSI